MAALVATAGIVTGIASAYFCAVPILMGLLVAVSSKFITDILSELKTIKKGKYFAKHKNTLNRGISNELEMKKNEKGVVIAKDCPYNGLIKVVEKTGDTKLDIMNVMNSDLTLRDLKKIKKAIDCVELMKKVEYLRQQQKEAILAAEESISGSAKIKNRIIH